METNQHEGYETCQSCGGVVAHEPEVVQFVGSRYNEEAAEEFARTPVCGCKE